jgi:hypothetical protein
VLRGLLFETFRHPRLSAVSAEVLSKAGCPSAVEFFPFDSAVGIAQGRQSLEVLCVSVASVVKNSNQAW